MMVVWRFKVMDACGSAPNAYKFSTTEEGAYRMMRKYQEGGWVTWTMPERVEVPTTKDKMVRWLNVNVPTKERLSAG